MTNNEDRFKRVLKRAEESAAKHAEAAETERRRSLSPAELRLEAERAWSPIREKLLSAVAEWNEGLGVHGYGVSASAEAKSGTLILETITVRANGPGRERFAPLTLSPVATLPGHISYSGPKGNVLNGNSGQLDLYKATPDEVIALVLGYLDQQVR